MNYFTIAKNVFIAVAILGAFLAGKSYEKNSQENKSRAGRILELESVLQAKDKLITTERLSRMSSDNIVSELKYKLESREVYIESLNKRIRKDENRINSTNRINGLFLRYITEAANNSPVPTIPNATSKPYGESGLYSAAEYLEYNVKQFKNCNDTADRLKKLQDWIRAQEKIYNH